MSVKSATGNRLIPLAEDTIGPYYHYGFLDGDRDDLTVLHHGLVVRPAGAAIVLRGRILDSAGAAVEDALLELWQANAAGLLRTPDNGLHPDSDPYFDGFARLITSREPFEFRTVKPGMLTGPGQEPPRAPHITVTIFADGITRLVTQIFFDDERAANSTDPLLLSMPEELRERVIARAISTEAQETTYEIDIVLRGESETPFFDDLSS